MKFRSDMYKTINFEAIRVGEIRKAKDLSAPSMYQWPRDTTAAYQVDHKTSFSALTQKTVLCGCYIYFESTQVCTCKRHKSDLRSLIL
jgi:hypothetical protein